MIELFNEDCYKVMENLIQKKIKIDAIITDPPYILEKLGGGKDEISQRLRRKCNEIDFIIEDFDYKKCFNMFLELMPVPNYIIFCSNKQISRTMSFFEDKKFSTTLLAWQKTNAIPSCNNTYKSDIEFIVWVRGDCCHFSNKDKERHKSKLFSMPFVAGKKRLHPTEKPLKLMLDLVRTHSYEGDIVFDPFMGSGTTGEACKILKRNFIGSELSKDFYQKADNRINSLLL